MCCGEVRLERVVVLCIEVRLFAAVLGSGRVRVETGCLLELGWWSAPRCDGGLRQHKLSEVRCQMLAYEMLLSMFTRPLQMLA